MQILIGAVVFALGCLFGVVMVGVGEELQKKRAGQKF